VVVIEGIIDLLFGVAHEVNLDVGDFGPVGHGCVLVLLAVERRVLVTGRTGKFGLRSLGAI